MVEGQTFSFHDLDARSNRVANGLVSIGVEPGDRVSLYGANCWEWIVAYYTIAKTGAVLNPISSMLTTQEVRYVVTDAGARVVIASADKGQTLIDLVGTDIGSLVLWGDDVPAGCVSLTEWIDAEQPEFVPSSTTARIWRRFATRPGQRAIPRGRCGITGR